MNRESQVRSGLQVDFQLGCKYAKLQVKGIGHLGLWHDTKLLVDSCHLDAGARA